MAIKKDKAKKEIKKSEKIEESIAVLNKRLNGTVVSKIKDAKALKLIKLPTGSLRLDFLLGGGLPYKRIIEIYGEEHIGKSFLATKIIAENQKLCHYCKKTKEKCGCDQFIPNRSLYQDYENSFVDKESEEKDEVTTEASIWLEKCGVDLENFAVYQPKTWQKGIDAIVYSIEDNLFDVIVIDSITNAANAKEQDSDAEDNSIALKAKANSFFCRQTSSAMSPENITDIREAYKPIIIVLNQVNANMDGGYGMVKVPTVYGGHALKHFKAISLEVMSTGFINEFGQTWTSSKQKKCGRILKIRVKKDKIGGNYSKETFLRYYTSDFTVLAETKSAPVLNRLKSVGVNTDELFMKFNAGDIDRIDEIFNLGKEFDFIQQSGAFYALDGIDGKVQGEDSVRVLLYFDKELRESLAERIKEKIYK